MKYADISLVNKVRLLIALTVLVSAAVYLAGRIGESAVYHDFSDKRPLIGIPNCLNVISNVPFLIIGLFGLRMVARTDAPTPLPLIYTLLFAGIFLTGLGSAWYHLAPDNNTLVYDRIPMTIVFMSLLSATVSECIHPKWGGFLLVPLVLIGAGSVLWWHYTELQGADDLRPYILVQYYPILLIPVIIWMFPSRQSGNGGPFLLRVVAWYIVAKLLDILDRSVYGFTGFISGHTLKHLAAAMATFYLVRLFKSKYLSYGTA